MRHRLFGMETIAEQALPRSLPLVAYLNLAHFHRLTATVIILFFYKAFHK